MRKFIVAIVAVGLSFQGKAQFQKVEIEAKDHLVKESSGIKPKPIDAQFIGFRNPPSDDATWHAVLYKVSDNESENNEMLERIKAEKYKLRLQVESEHKTSPASKTTTLGKSPIVSTNFAGINNGGNYTPLDNTIAISDKDTIVAMANVQIGYYTITGTNYYGKGLYTLINDPTLTNQLCDPKIIWDNVARRFIFYCQVCDQVSAHSKIVLGFSKTSNPSNGWFIYEFTGNPTGTTDWWDYPKMAVSNDELFVTGNLFQEGSNNFDQSVIMQIQKNPCFAGTTPLTHVYSGIGTTFVPFTILPVSYGQKGSYGPGIYAVSTENLSGGSNNYYLYDITNNIASGAAVLNVYGITASNYSPPGNSPQYGGSLPLNTGDCRALDGFYLKGTLHFVNNIDAGSGFCGFRYSRINIKALTAGSANYSNVPKMDYCYPAIASAVNDSNDNSVVIAFNQSGDTTFPGSSVVGFDVNNNWSAPVNVKSGDSYVSFSPTGNPYERWGDYTGLCKLTGDPAASLWMAGMYGSTAHDWQQWIAKIGPKDDAAPVVTIPETGSKIYPNPVEDRYTVQFSLTERQNIIINITDMEGRNVVELYNGMVESGENNISFNKGNLANGVYSLNIIGANTNIKNEKIVISAK